jgi:hypothetical protein
VSEPDRLRRLHVENRLAELRAKHGEPEAHEPPSVDLDPSWGPVGSLARARLDPEVYAHLMALHNDMLALERSRKAPPPMPQPEPDNTPASAPAPETDVPMVWQRATLS